MKHGILWIGFGNFAKRLASKVPLRNDIKILLYFHPDQTKAVQRFGVKAEWDLDRALSNSEIDVVFITTPNDKHAEYIKAALQYGKHVFVEKPLTADLTDTLKLLPQLRNNKNVFMVGHNMRRRRAIRRVKTILASGVIGKVVSVYVNASKGIAFDLSPTNWRFSQTRHREGPLITLGIHLIDVFHYLFGAIHSASAIIKNISGKTEAPDSSAVLLNLECGATAFMEANYNTPSEDILNIYGTDGSIYLHRDNLHYRLGRDKNRISSGLVPVELDNINTLAEETDEFFAAIEGRARIETGYQEALNALTVVEACFQSHQDRRQIEIKSITREYFQNKSA